jgi:hypothetical protein
MKIIMPIEWQEVASRKICGAPPEVSRDERAVTHRFIETRPYHWNVDSEKIIQHWIDIHIFKSIYQRRDNQALITNSEMQMSGIPKFALSRPGYSIVDVNAHTYFPEGSTTTPQNCSDA